MHVAIIGNGVTGVSAAMRIRELRPDWRISMISGESTHHYSRPALMYIFMGHMRYQDTKPYEDWVWRDRRIDLVRDWVTAIDPESHALELHRGGRMAYDKLLIATGSAPNRFGWPGQDLDGVQGLWGLYDLHTLYATTERTRSAVIVGGGLIGIELAEMMHSRGVHVTFLVREKSYWSNVLPPEESAMINRRIRAEGFDLRLESELAAIIDDGQGRCAGIETKSGERIECQMVGLTAGVHPNIDLVKESPIASGRGVLVDASLRTNAADVWAAGDCAEIVRDGEARNLLQQVWYTGKMQGRVAGASIAGEDTVYDPGIWYNSAKFLDLEYQTYGEVIPGREGDAHLWWETDIPRRGACGIRIVQRDGAVCGVNVMGIRHRHEAWRTWLAERRPLTYILDHLAEANFDPEFHRRFEHEAAARFRAESAMAEPIA